LDGPEPGLETSAAIGQTGTIPSDAETLTFFASLFGAVQVTFNGQNLPYNAIGSGVNYTIYGASIGSYAGQTGQLLFTSPANTTALFDNIQFSTTAIPEPGVLNLSSLCVLVLCWRMNGPKAA
jgi:hypothetical protein